MQIYQIFFILKQRRPLEYLIVLCMVHDLKTFLPQFPPELLALLAEKARITRVDAGTTLLRVGSYVSAVPIVLEGLIKVDRPDEVRELLLYYIQAGESCVMSFQAAMRERPSGVVAVAEQDSEVLLVPSEVLREAYPLYPALQRYFFDLSNRRYEGLLATIDQLAFRKLDERLMAYFQQKTTVRQTHELQITHQQIADEMGTSREVISRALKKLEAEGWIQLGRNQVHILRTL